jgi:hypothetical protein
VRTPASADWLTCLSETLIDLSFRRPPEQGHDERTHERNMWIARTQRIFFFGAVTRSVFRLY